MRKIVLGLDVLALAACLLVAVDLWQDDTIRHVVDRDRSSQLVESFTVPEVRDFARKMLTLAAVTEDELNASLKFTKWASTILSIVLVLNLVVLIRNREQ